MRLEFHRIVGGFAGLGRSVEQEKCAAAVEQRVGLPCRVVFDCKSVVGSGQRAFGVFAFEPSLGEVAPDFLGRRAWIIGRCDEREALGCEFEVARVVGLDAAPLECLGRNVGGEIIFDRELDFGGELWCVLRSEVTQREEDASVFGVGIGAQGACGFEVFDRLAGLVAFDEPPTDPVAGLGAQVGAEVGDIFQKPLIAVHHFRDVVFLAAQARRFEPRERHQIFRGRWVGDELVVIGECLARLGEFGVGRRAFGDRRGNARIIRKARDEFVERANRT